MPVAYHALTSCFPSWGPVARGPAIAKGRPPVRRRPRPMAPPDEQPELTATPEDYPGDLIREVPFT
jgi:hypothetical protein